MHTFKAGDVLAMAIKAEEQGQRFYQACEKKVRDSKARNVFHYLIDQEKIHARIFEKMKTQTEEIDLPESYPGEMETYAASFIKGRVFFEPEKAADLIDRETGFQDVIELALDFERRSIAFYSGLKDLIPAAEHDQLDRVISEEHRHIRRLISLIRPDREKGI